MGIETLNTMNEGMYPSLMMLIKLIVLITMFFISAGLVICLAGITWLCFQEMRQPARRRLKPAPEPPEPAAYDLLAVLATLEDDLGGNLTGGVARRPPGVTMDFIGVSQTFAATELETVAAPSDRRPPAGSLNQTMLARGHEHGRKRKTP